MIELAHFTVPSAAVKRRTRLRLVALWLASFAVPAVSARILANSTKDFSATQGFRNWYYGYFPNGDPHFFTMLPFFNSQTQMWQQQTTPPFTQVGANSFCQPNGTNSGQEQWAVREWRSNYTGQVFVSGRMSKLDITPGTGVYGRIYLNHQQVAVSPLVTYENGVDLSATVTVAPGDVIDIALAPNGADNNDLSYFSATISTTVNTVEVDFSKPTPVHSASGFLFGIQVNTDLSPGSAPPQNLITPLNPVKWRGYARPEWYQRTQAIAPNSTIDLITWAQYGIAGDNYFGNGPPWLNLPGYETFMQNLLSPFPTAPATGYFEPWGEPDDSWSPYSLPGTVSYKHNWSGTTEQFFETYLHAFRAARNELGLTAQLEGPCFGLCDRVTIQQFLEYCLANGCEVNTLSWHNLDDTAPDRPFITARDARTSFFDNPRYAPLKIRRLDINEMVGARYIVQPAGSLAFYRQFELGGADGANRACWSDPHTGGDNCGSGSMTGLLTQNTFQPRGVWYAHWAYADGVDTRVQSDVSDTSIVALASSSTASSAAPQILLAYVDYQTFLQGKAEFRGFHLTLNHVDLLTGLAGATNVILRIDKIPDTEELPLSQLQPVADIPVTVSGGVIDVDLPGIALGDVHRIRLINPATPVPSVSTVVDHAAGSTGLTPGMPVLVTGAGFDNSAVVSIGNEIAPMLKFLDSSRMIAQVPVDAPLGATMLVVAVHGQTSAPFKINLVDLAAEIEPAQSADGSPFYDSSGAPITAAHPAIPGAQIYCIAIGLGATNPPQATNTIANTQAPTTKSVQITLGNKAVQSIYAGLFVGGTPGYYQVSFTLPADAAAGSLPVSLAVGGPAGNTQILIVGPPIPLLSSQGVVPATVQAGEWVSLYGTNLATSVATWAGDFPTVLGGASVTVGGQPAWLSYSSPGQINFQVPDLTSTGPVPIAVKTAVGTGSSTITLAPLSPYFFVLDAKHVAAIILRPNGGGAYGGGSYDILGPTGNSLGYGTVAARAGDLIELFGSGFGPTDPSVPSGRLFSGAAPATTPITLRINNVNISPSFAGLSGPGLFQINFTVPTGLGTGDVPLQAILGGQQTPAGIVISLR